MNKFFRKIFVAVKPYLYPLFCWLCAVVCFAVSAGDDPNWLIAGGIFLGVCMNEILSFQIRSLAKGEEK